MKQKPKPKREPSLFDAIELEIRAQLSDITRRRAKKGADFDKDLALSTAALVRAQVSLEGERRKTLRAVMKALESFSDDQIINHLRSMTDARRRSVVREALGEADEDPLL